MCSSDLVADHVKNVLANYRSLAYHANARRPRGQNEAIHFVILLDDPGIRGACCQLHLDAGVQRTNRRSFWLYSSISCALLAVFSGPGASAGFTVVLWLTAQPQANITRNAKGTARILRRPLSWGRWMITNYEI